MRYDVVHQRLNQFFKELAANNNKEWFDANRKRYETSVKEPFKNFVAEVIKQVHTMMNGSILSPRMRSSGSTGIFGSQGQNTVQIEFKCDRSAAGRKDRPRRELFRTGTGDVKIYGGAYMPDKDQLLKIRKTIMDDHKAFRRTIDGEAFRTCS